MASMEQVPAAAGRADSPGKLLVQTFGFGTVDSGAGTARTRDAHAFATRAAYATHRDQTLPLYRRELSPHRARSLEQGLEAHAGSFGRSSRFGRALGDRVGGPHLSR